MAAHEIGHALGFTSIVELDFLNAPGPLDLFRFDSTFFNPVDAGQFAFFPRSFLQGAPAIFDDLEQELLLSTGAGPQGDGRQSSHWKDDAPDGPADRYHGPDLWHWSDQRGQRQRPAGDRRAGLHDRASLT